MSFNPFAVIDCSFLIILLLLYEIKKCVAEATHEKCTAPFAATQSFNTFENTNMQKWRMHFYRCKNVFPNVFNI